MIALHLPWPPSTNRLWRAVKGRVIQSAAYRAWLGSAASWIESQGSPHLKGPFRIEIIARAPDRRRRDLDNLAKPVLDALTASMLIEDDSRAREIVLRWSDSAPAKPGAITVTLEAA